MLSLPSFLSLAFSLLLGGALLWKRRDAPLLFRLLPVIMVVAWIQGVNGVWHLAREDWSWWNRSLLAGELAFPVALGYVSQSFYRMLDDVSHSKIQWWWRGTAGVAILLIGAVFLYPEMIMQTTAQGEMIFNRGADWLFGDLFYFP